MIEPEGNRLLACLPFTDYERLLPFLNPIVLHAGQPLWEEERNIERVLFPVQGLISEVLSSTKGMDVEVSVIGREGLAGSECALGGGALFRSVVQVEGAAWTLPADVFKKEFARGEALHFLVLRYTQLLLAQAAQTALCNRVHTVEERLARWLLVVRDRLGSDHLNITHEFISQMLGARRSGVTVAAGTLRQAGLIGYTRGSITLLDRGGLQAASCDCYKIFRRSLLDTEASALRPQPDKRPAVGAAMPSTIAPSQPNQGQRPHEFDNGKPGFEIVAATC